MRSEGSERVSRVRHHSGRKVSRYRVVRILEKNDRSWIRIDRSVGISFTQLRLFCSNEEDKSWKATWYVTSREDIGDFYVVVRESGSSKSAIEKDLVYSERSFKIPELQDSGTKYELCVLARDSEGNVKHFRSSQCRILAQHGLDSSTSRFAVNAFLILIAVSFGTLA